MKSCAVRTSSPAPNVRPRRLAVRRASGKVQARGRGSRWKTQTKKKNADRDRGRTFSVSRAPGDGRGDCNAFADRTARVERRRADGQCVGRLIGVLESAVQPVPGVLRASNPRWNAGARTCPLRGGRRRTALTAHREVPALEEDRTARGCCGALSAWANHLSSVRCLSRCPRRTAASGRFRPVTMGGRAGTGWRKWNANGLLGHQADLARRQPP